MPFVLEPGEERLFWFSAHDQIPLNDRPAFVCQAATGRLQRKHAQAIVDFEATEDVYVKAVKNGEGIAAQANARLARREKITAIAKVGVIGSRNVTVDGKPAASLDEALDELDDDLLYTLAARWPTAHRVTEDDRKNSCSPLPSGAENSAPNAPAENVTTNPTPTVPSTPSISPAPSAGATRSVESIVPPVTDAAS